MLNRNVFKQTKIHIAKCSMDFLSVIYISYTKKMKFDIKIIEIISIVIIGN